MARRQDLHVAAAGIGSRLAETMCAAGYEASFPKHLLPTGGPEGETLLGRIIRQALAAPIDGVVVVHTNVDNSDHIKHHPDIDPSAQIVIDRQQGNSLGAYMQALSETQSRAMGSAGDFYADYSWQDILDHHESNPWPITFVAGQSIPVDGGAAFDVDDRGRIERLRRSDRTAESDLINTGIYVFDPAEPVLTAVEDALRAAQKDAEDSFVHRIIDEQLVGAYVLDAPSFNVNTDETYAALLQHTAQKS